MAGSRSLGRNALYSSKKSWLGALTGAITFPISYFAHFLLHGTAIALLSPVLLVSHFRSQYLNRRDEGKGRIRAFLETLIISPIVLLLKTGIKLFATALPAVMTIFSGATTGYRHGFKFAVLDAPSVLKAIFNRFFFGYEKDDLNKQSLEARQKDLADCENTLKAIQSPTKEQTDELKNTQNELENLQYFNPTSLIRRLGAYIARLVAYTLPVKQLNEFIAERSPNFTLHSKFETTPAFTAYASKMFNVLKGNYLDKTEIEFRPKKAIITNMVNQLPRKNETPLYLNDAEEKLISAKLTLNKNDPLANLYKAQVQLKKSITECKDCLTSEPVDMLKYDCVSIHIANLENANHFVTYSMDSFKSIVLLNSSSNETYSKAWKQINSPNPSVTPEVARADQTLHFIQQTLINTPVENISLSTVGNETAISFGNDIKVIRKNGIVEKYNELAATIRAMINPSNDANNSNTNADVNQVRAGRIPSFVREMAARNNPKLDSDTNPAPKSPTSSKR